jgi:catechol 2,3-dioxygenase-like lactoylglutathione lyase family enzyme
MGCGGGRTDPALVGVGVADRDRVLAFYTGVLGLSVKSSDGSATS